MTRTIRTVLFAGAAVALLATAACHKKVPDAAASDAASTAAASDSMAATAPASDAMAAPASK
jgi:hypothetical protein